MQRLGLPIVLNDGDPEPRLETALHRGRQRSAGGLHHAHAGELDLGGVQQHLQHRGRGDHSVHPVAFNRHEEVVQTELAQHDGVSSGVVREDQRTESARVGEREGDQRRRPVTGLDVVGTRPPLQGGTDRRVRLVEGPMAEDRPLGTAGRPGGEYDHRGILGGNRLRLDHAAGRWERLRPSGRHTRTVGEGPTLGSGFPRDLVLVRVHQHQGDLRVLNGEAQFTSRLGVVHRDRRGAAPPARVQRHDHVQPIGKDQPHGVT